MRTWIKNGTRATILVTAFAVLGAGLAVRRRSRREGQPQES
jgi:hypothetical protein